MRLLAEKAVELDLPPTVSHMTVQRILKKPELGPHLAERLELHDTPKHGSCLNVAEIELSVLQRQCLDRRIPDRDTMHSEIAAGEGDRNHRPSKIDWQFTTSDARIKLKHVSPKL